MLSLQQTQATKLNTIGVMPLMNLVVRSRWPFYYIKAYEYSLKVFCQKFLIAFIKLCICRWVDCSHNQLLLFDGLYKHQFDQFILSMAQISNSSMINNFKKANVTTLILYCRSSFLYITYKPSFTIYNRPAQPLMKQYYQSLITNHNKDKISVSKMQMTTPYYPESNLAKSKFHGFYSLFYIFTVYFSIVYPTLNFIKTGNFFQKTLFKLLQFNIFCDVLSLILFLVLSFCLMSLSHLTKAICKNLTKRQTAFVFIPFVGLLWSIYVGLGFFIVRNYHMYFTDKIFIVVISWVFFIKTLSYIFDMHQIVEITAKFQVKRTQVQAKSSQEKYKSSEENEEKQEKQVSLQEITFVKKSSDLLQESLAEKIRTKLIYLISPEIVFKHFVLNHDKSLTIHPIYILNKILVSLVCSMVNLIIMIEMLEPLCSKQSLEKYQLIELFFRFIPPIFYINICLYFMILENIIPAIAQATKMKSRIFYEDWWNAENLYDFLDRWVLMINSFTKEYLTLFWQNRKLRQTIHVAIILFLIYEIFSIQERKISLMPFLMLSMGVLLCTFFLGGINKIQNNYIVHMIIFGFSPLMLAIQMKFNIFTGQQK